MAKLCGIGRDAMEAQQEDKCVRAILAHARAVRIARGLCSFRSMELLHDAPPIREAYALCQ
jgi:hypothetical protein